MKALYILPLCIFMGFTSCDSDDASDDTQEGSTGEFFPTTANSTWNYENTNETGDTEDMMFVAGEQQENGQTYTNLDTQALANGFMVNMLTTNLVRTTDTQLYVQGTLGAPIEGLPDLIIPLDDFKLYDTAVDAATNPILATQAGSFQQDFMGFPLVIDFSLSSITLGAAPTSNEANPSIQSTVNLTLEISTLVMVGGVELPFPILAEQEVFIATNTYVDGVGLQLSDVVINYELEDLSGLGIELPFPQSTTELSNTVLASFEIGD